MELNGSKWNLIEFNMDISSHKKVGSNGNKMFVIDSPLKTINVYKIVHFIPFSSSFLHSFFVLSHFTSMKHRKAGLEFQLNGNKWCWTPPPITEIAQFNKDHNACRKFQIFAHFAFMWPRMIFGSFLIMFWPNLNIFQ